MFIAGTFDHVRFDACPLVRRGRGPEHRMTKEHCETGVEMAKLERKNSMTFEPRRLAKRHALAVT